MSTHCETCQQKGDKCDVGIGIGPSQNLNLRHKVLFRIEIHRPEILDNGRE